MKLTIDARPILGCMDDRDGKYPRVTLLLDDGKGKDGRQNVIGVELSGKALNEVKGMPEPGDRFEGECFVSSREYNGRVFTTVRAWKFNLIPARRQPGHNPEPSGGGAAEDDVPFGPVTDRW